jgi:hypothetical protein
VRERLSDREVEGEEYDNVDDCDVADETDIADGGDKLEDDNIDEVEGEAEGEEYDNVDDCDVADETDIVDDDGWLEELDDNDELEDVDIVTGNSPMLDIVVGVVALVINNGVLVQLHSL